MHRVGLQTTSARTKKKQPLASSGRNLWRCQQWLSRSLPASTSPSLCSPESSVCIWNNCDLYSSSLSCLEGTVSSKPPSTPHEPCLRTPFHAWTVLFTLNQLTRLRGQVCPGSWPKVWHWSSSHWKACFGTKNHNKIWCLDTKTNMNDLISSSSSSTMFNYYYKMFIRQSQRHQSSVCWAGFKTKSRTCQSTTSARTGTMAKCWEHWSTAVRQVRARFEAKKVSNHINTELFTSL